MSKSGLRPHALECSIMPCEVTEIVRWIAKQGAGERKELQAQRERLGDAAFYMKVVLPNSRNNLG